MNFSSVEHLSTEAVAAFVDDELTPGAAHRARIHLVHCKECRDEVNRQRQAADALRRSAGEAGPAIPGSLIAKLTNLPETQPVAEAAAAPRPARKFGVLGRFLHRLS